VGTDVHARGKPVEQGRQAVFELAGQGGQPPGRHRWLTVIEFGGIIVVAFTLAVGVQADRLVNEMSEADGEHARTAAGIQQPAGPVQTRLLGQDRFEPG
jgi:hypothetical protein